jgi:YVTN family beta-propeller protein
MKRQLHILLGFLIFLCACVETPTSAPPNFTPTASSRVALVLNEGLFQRNNASLTRYEIDSSRAFTDFFEQQVGRRLGDTGNDLAQYGGKIYIVVNISSTIEVLDASTFVSLGTISLFNGTQPRQPRHIAFHGRYAFASCYDGTIAVVDTASLAVARNIQVGAYPEGVAVQNAKLYVANSGGLNFPNYDSTISIIDLNTLTEIKRLTLRINPTAVAADPYGNVYVISNGNYSTVPLRLLKIDSQTDAIKKIYDFDASRIAIHDSLAFIASNGGIKLLNIKNDSVLNENLIAPSNFQILYGISIDGARQELYCADAKTYVVNGEMKVFDFNGQFKRGFQTGLIPSKTIFVR